MQGMFLIGIWEILVALVFYIIVSLPPVWLLSYARIPI